MSELWFKPACELAEAIQAKELSLRGRTELPASGEGTSPSYLRWCIMRPRVSRVEA